MPFSNESPPVSTLVIPTGATTGARIVLNGLTGQIQVYNSSNVLVAQIDSTGLQTYSSSGTSSTIISPGPPTTIKMLPSGGNVNAGTITSGVTGGGQPELIFQSPQQTASSPNNTSSIVMFGANNNLPASQVVISADDIALQATITGSGTTAQLGLGGLQAGGAVSGVALIGGNGSTIGMDTSGGALANEIFISATTITTNPSIDHINGAWNNFSFSNGWTNGGGAGYRLVAAPKSSVQLFGQLNPGTKTDGTLVFTLPVGFRPATSFNFPITCDTQVLAQNPHLLIHTDGTAVCFGVGSATFMSL